VCDDGGPIEVLLRGQGRAVLLSIGGARDGRS
jgi:hypothetical protein